MTAISEPVDVKHLEPVIFEVRGVPAPQGSKRPVILGKGANRRIGMVESSAKVAPWRAAVRAVAELRFAAPLAGPVSVVLLFWMPRPQRPQDPDYPVVMPDLDKLVRSTLDGLAEGRAFSNDSQVCSIVTTKAYGPPGCHITVQAMR